MPKPLPHIIRRIEETGSIPADLRAIDPSLHFCPDWDWLLIDKTDPEFDACTCQPTK